MQANSDEHAEIMASFEREYKGRRLDREDKPFWRLGRVYQDGAVNDLFLAYRQGYALGRCVYLLARS